MKTLFLLLDFTLIIVNNRRITTSSFFNLLPSFSFKTQHISFVLAVLATLYLLCVLYFHCLKYLCLLRVVLASWRKCVSTTFTTTPVPSWSSARATLTKDTCRNILTSLTGSAGTQHFPLPKTISYSFSFPSSSHMWLSHFCSQLISSWGRVVITLSKSKTVSW